MVEKEVPIKIIFSDDVMRPRKFVQHIKRVHLLGPASEFPEEIRLDADEIVEGGMLTIDDLMLPDGFEVVDRREADPIITVERPKKMQRRKRHGYDEE